MSSRSVGRGRCPRCGQDGIIVVKCVSGREYVYFRHGRKWCYIGPADRVDITKLITVENKYRARLRLCSRNIVTILCVSAIVILTTAIVLNYAHFQNPNKNVEDKINTIIRGVGFSKFGTCNATMLNNYLIAYCICFPHKHPEFIIVKIKRRINITKIPHIHIPSN